MNSKTAEVARPLTSVALWEGARADIIIGLALFFISGLAATSYWNRWVAAGNQPQFYQHYFEPAVMIACGKGFVVSKPQPAALAEFLTVHRDRFDCHDIPANASLGRDGLFQGAWRYLLTTVGWYWRVRGVSWSGMGALFGLLFAATIVLAYGICRLGMGPTLATIASLGFATSTIHINNLPHLRDYAKAPFTLALIFLLGLLVTWPVRQRTVLLLSAAYGILLAIGYGFRTDFLANLPVFPVVVFAFLAGGPKRNLLLKIAATGLFFVIFIVVSWPVTSTVYENGGCQWHVTLLGLQTPFDSSLRIVRAPYDFGYEYLDGYIYRTVSVFASRQPNGPNKVDYCSHEYDVESGRLLESYVAAFPADFVTRALASVSQIVEMPFGWPLPKSSGGFVGMLYSARMQLLQPLLGTGKYLVAATLLLVSIFSLRLALFLLFFLIYFCGYPAVQFHDRHYFHLEIVSWWSLGFLVHQVIHGLRNWRKIRTSAGKFRLVTLVQPGLLVVAALLLVVVPLKVLRAYQGRTARKLLTSYIDAPKDTLLNGAINDGFYKVVAPDPVRPLQFPYQFIEVDLNLESCSALSMNLRYDPAFQDADFSRNLTIRQPLPRGQLRIFMLMFEHFQGISFAGAQSNCVAGVYRLSDTSKFPLLVDAILLPEWDHQPLYQRLADWE